MPPPPPGAAHGGPFSLSTPGALEGFIEAAGFSPVGGREVPCPLRYPDLDTDAVRDALVQALQWFVQPDGGVRLDCTFRYVVGGAAPSA